LELNSGFRPFVVSGEALHLYSLNRLNPDVLLPASSPRALSYIETAASTSGKEARIKFQVALPLTLNQRDPVGLILLQNEETTVSLNIDTARAQDAYQLATENYAYDRDVFRPFRTASRAGYFCPEAC
ncbi:hypothetical protein ACWKSR_10115, partial [Campylobacter fetus subsp. venerealis]